MVEIGSVTAEILLTLSLCGWVGGGGLKSFSCHTQLLSWVEVELGLWQYRGKQQYYAQVNNNPQCTGKQKYYSQLNNNTQYRAKQQYYTQINNNTHYRAKQKYYSHLNNDTKYIAKQQCYTQVNNNPQFRAKQQYTAAQQYQYFSTQQGKMITWSKQEHKIITNKLNR